jgi:secreted trypsin-like serine protease
VLAGTSRASPAATANVLRFWVEPSYAPSTNPSQRIDLSILELVGPFSLNSNVGVIPLCQVADNCGATGASLTVSGYGETQSDVGSSVATNLQWANLVAVDQTVCVAKFNSNFNCNGCLPTTNVCAGANAPGGNQDSCFGDSGGPLATATGTRKLWGVVSSGTVPADQTPSCGKPGEYGVYVSVPPNLAWINSVLNGQQNGTAIDNACIAQGTCSTGGFTPGNPNSSFFPPFMWQWYYILAIVGGVALLVLIIVLLCCCCRK